MKHVPELHGKAIEDIARWTRARSYSSLQEGVNYALATNLNFYVGRHLVSDDIVCYCWHDSRVWAEGELFGWSEEIYGEDKDGKRIIIDRRVPEKIVNITEYKRDEWMKFMDPAFKSEPKPKKNTSGMSLVTRKINV